MQQSTRLQARSEIQPQGTNETRDPSVVFGSIDPNRKVATRFNFRCQRIETVDRIAKNIDDAKTESVVENLRERYATNIGLDDVNIFLAAGRSKRGVDS